MNDNIDIGKLAVTVLTLIFMVCSCKNTKFLINETSLGLKEENSIYGTIISSKEYHNVMLYKVKTKLDTIYLISYKGRKNNNSDIRDGVFSIRKIRYFRLLFPNMPQVTSLILQNDTIHFLYTDSVFIHVNRNIKFFKDSKQEKLMQAKQKKRTIYYEKLIINQ